MTYRRKSAPASLIAVVLAAAAFAGCTSASRIDTAFSDLTPRSPAAAPLPSPAAPGDGLNAAAAAPSRTTEATATRLAATPPPDGAYIPIGAEPPPSPNQMTDAERNALLAEMEGLRNRLTAESDRAGPTPQSNPNQIRRDAAAHEAEVLRRIETDAP